MPPGVGRSVGSLSPVTMSVIRCCRPTGGTVEINLEADDGTPTRRYRRR
jgi:hypothetical protein